MPIIDWTIQTHRPTGLVSLSSQFADFRNLDQPLHGLADRIHCALRLFPCDILFVHRDAETCTRDQRISEIEQALHSTDITRHVKVIPVRMTEAWLLISETAIRKAAGNPNGDVALDLPLLTRLEQLPDPKEVLRDLLVIAAQFTGRRRNKFKKELAWRCQRVADQITDFSPLQNLPAFRSFEQDTRRILHEEFNSG
ncbi:MAG: hypothetical protein ABIG44_18025 [Planctomycetota bacterium]